MKTLSPTAILCATTLVTGAAGAVPVIRVNQIGYDARGPKVALIQTDAPLPEPATASLYDESSAASVATITLGAATTNEEWAPGKFFYRTDFSSFQMAGTYRVQADVDGSSIASEAFRIEDNALANLTFPSIVGYYQNQRADSPEEWAADEAVLLNDGSKTVDMRGGWCDASGDVSKYFSHLAYANFIGPQQTPMVTWELTDTVERVPELLTTAGIKESFEDEALWGADYLYRALSSEGYFHMVVFSFFSSNAGDRKVVGLLANNQTNDKWQATFRAGGGMAIAALARISQWKKDGQYFTSQNYLDGAKLAFAHLLEHNTEYVDDGKENIIDDYSALMAASELWIATGEESYRDEARKRMTNLSGRMTPGGYFRADDSTRPFWHAADAGLPVVALVRYLDQETDAGHRSTALATIKQALDYELAVTNEVSNPYGYARQSFLYQGAVKSGFFIPQENETGWWWQGENARLASLAAAAILGGRLVYPAEGGWGVQEELATFASQQLAWILGANPYDACFMDGFGKNNPPQLTSNFGHGTSKGGISNGITGSKGALDGSGIEYRTEDGGNEWRWIEQWIPHSGWFLTAAAAMAQIPPTTDVPTESSGGAGGSGGLSAAGAGGVPTSAGAGGNASVATAGGGVPSTTAAPTSPHADKSSCSCSLPSQGDGHPSPWLLLPFAALVGRRRNERRRYRRYAC
jgi:MYXO-CTERM domain-containing protein